MFQTGFRFYVYCSSKNKRFELRIQKSVIVILMFVYGYNKKGDVVPLKIFCDERLVLIRLLRFHLDFIDLNAERSEIVGTLIDFGGNPAGSLENKRQTLLVLSWDLNGNRAGIVWTS